MLLSSGNISYKYWQVIIGLLYRCVFPYKTINITFNVYSGSSKEIEGKSTFNYALKNVFICGQYIVPSSLKSIFMTAHYGPALVYSITLIYAVITKRASSSWSYRRKLVKKSRTCFFMKCGKNYEDQTFLSLLVKKLVFLD